MLALLAIGGRLWSRQGRIDPRLVGTWAGSNALLGFEQNGLVDKHELWCRGFPPTYQWSVQGNELWIETFPHNNPLGSLAEFQYALGLYRDRLLHREKLLARYEIIELTSSNLRLRTLSSCDPGESQVKEYVRYQR